MGAIKYAANGWSLSLSKFMVTFERKAYERGYRVIAGVDEVGRGPLAGPVVAAAVILPICNCIEPTKSCLCRSPQAISNLQETFPEGSCLSGIRDSKKLTPKQRAKFANLIHRLAKSVAIVGINEATIDKLNILQATKLAMYQAIARLDPQPDYLLIDAVALSKLDIPHHPIIKGDTLSRSIAAASIVAKVYRDQLMCQYHERYPNYGFNRHMGYPTPAHLEALRTYGPCPIHRRSFRGVL